MKNKLLLSNIDFLLSDSILFITGLIICLFNINLVRIASKAIGLFSLILGIYLLYVFFVKHKTDSSPFFMGAICFIVGIFMTFKTDTFISFLPTVIGLIVTICSLVEFKNTLFLKHNNDTYSTFLLIINIIFLVIGLGLFLHPIQSLSSIIKIVGGVMIFYSIYLFVVSVMTHKYMN